MSCKINSSTTHSATKSRLSSDPFDSVLIFYVGNANIAQSETLKYVSLAWKHSNTMQSSYTGQNACHVACKRNGHSFQCYHRVTTLYHFLLKPVVRDVHLCMLCKNVPLPSPLHGSIQKHCNLRILDETCAVSRWYWHVMDRTITIPSNPPGSCRDPHCTRLHLYPSWHCCCPLIFLLGHCLYVSSREMSSLLLVQLFHQAS